MIFIFHFNCYLLTQIVLLLKRYQIMIIKSKNVYEEIFKRKDLFDFSNYSKDSKFFNETNKKIIGKIKDEFDGVIVTEFVGLKSKMFSMKNIDGKECNTAKGVSIATDFDKYIFKNIANTVFKGE